jgi:alpha-beta hydrolase superfamily lysophospholipase
VHDGFYAALFHRPEGSRVCLFDELVDILKEVGSDEEAGEQLPLFLTGHSLGGAIASVFAAALRAEARL